MEYTIKNSNGPSVTLSKIEGDKNIFVATIESGSYQYGVNTESNECAFFEPAGGPRISVGANLQEFDESFPSLVINYIGAGKDIIVVKTEEPQES